jgi:pSer/pThr/pTyr-binding forkhead associated (FHA) protein
MNTQISFKQFDTNLQFSQLENVDEALACSRGQNPSMRHGLTTSGWLLGLNGLHIGEDLRLFPGSNVIGSSARCHVVLTAPGVGRQHAIIDVLSGESALLQPGSTQRELFLNDLACTASAPLCHGDVIRIGEQNFAYIALLPSRNDEQTTIIFKERFPTRGTCTLGWLVELAGDRVGRDFRLIQGENRIGSQRGLEVVLFDPEIQPRQAVITRHSDNWIIVPVSVSDPVFVNGVPSTGTGLHNGDIVRLGQREFLFRCLKVGFAK